MFKRRKLPPGYTIRAEQPIESYGNFLVLRDSSTRILAVADLLLDSVWFANRKLRKIAWVDYNGRNK